MQLYLDYRTSINPQKKSRNSLHSAVPGGSCAVIFSSIETAKENGLDPYRYLTFVLKEASKLKVQNPDWAAKLLPSNAPDTCKI